MKIIKLEVDGFRSLKSQTWCPGDLNVVIGPNASGKSNLLRVLEALQAAATAKLGAYVQQEGGMEPLVWDGRDPGIRIRGKMTPLPPYSNAVTDALTYGLSLARLGRSSAYRIEHEVLGNYYKVETGEMQEPFKLLERDPRHAVVFSMDSKRFESIPTTTTVETPYDSERERIEAPEDSLPEEETLLHDSAVEADPRAAWESSAKLRCSSRAASWRPYGRQ